jgi:hypothetical protein
MSVRFQKRLGLGKLARLNFSRSGIGLSIGPRGSSISFGPRGVYGNIGLPGTGLSWRERLDSPAPRHRRKAIAVAKSSSEMTGSEYYAALQELKQKVAAWEDQHPVLSKVEQITLDETKKELAEREADAIRRMQAEQQQPGLLQQVGANDVVQFAAGFIVGRIVAAVALPVVFFILMIIIGSIG